MILTDTQNVNGANKESPYKEEPPKQRLLAQRLWHEYVVEYWSRILLSIGFMVLLAVSDASLPLITEWIFSAYQQENDSSRFFATPEQVKIYGPPLLIGSGLLLALSRLMYSRLTQGTAVLVLRDLQKAMYRSYLKFDYAQVRSDGTGQLVSRFTNDTLTLRESLTRAPNAVKDLFRIVVLLGLMLFTDWALTLVVLLIYPVVGVPIMRISRKLRRTAAKVQGQVGDMTSLLSESFQGARMVKTYNLESYEYERAAETFNTRQVLLRKVVNAKALNDPLITTVGAIAAAGVIGVAAWRIDAGLLDGPQLINFIITLLLLSQPTRSLGTLNAVLQEGYAALARVFWVIDRTAEIQDDPEAPDLEIIEDQTHPVIDLKNVTFSYGKEKVLEGFSLSVQRGQTIALVGESGAGKSTVFNLLPRLYEAQSGDILIFNQNIQDVSIKSLRASMALVSQDAVLFDDTVAANIRFGDEEATPDQIKAAAKSAAADEFIEEMSEGYNTSVGAQGGNLSGGQRQRIALARAFLKDAPILLLDEATSALDAESERKVQAALDNLTKGRTTIVIAHRLATVRNADIICVIDKGKIVEQGTHDTLLAQKGIYAKLASLQFRED